MHTTHPAFSGQTPRGTRLIGILFRRFTPNSKVTANSSTNLDGRNYHVAIASTNANHALTTDALSATNPANLTITSTNAFTRHFQSCLDLLNTLLDPELLDMICIGISGHFHQKPSSVQQ
jgi:hypothetical protein